MEERELKAKMFKLLKEDEEFRYTVAGLLGLQEVLKRLNEQREELIKLRKNMVEGFEKRDVTLIELRKDMVEGFRRHDEEFAKLRKDMVEGFRRHDEEFAKLRKDMVEGFRRHDEEITRLREDMTRGFELVNRHVSALGARWGLMAEEAFREGLRGLLEKELGLKVEKWRTYDKSGKVFGYPSEVEVDIAVKDRKLILVEVSSHIKASDVFQFKRKAELYQEETGRKPDKLVIVTPYIDEKAVEASQQLGIEVYTKV